MYERHGDLLFTPAPNQEYIEKISLRRSYSDQFGLRGKFKKLNRAKHLVLCLGDSITYGYGVDDDHSYPAQLQQALDQGSPGEFEVLNAGVNAYTISLMDQKFLNLWQLGIHPDVALVGYSMNDSWLGALVDSSPVLKDKFADRVRVKNYLRKLGLYNLLVEKWARAYYDKLKGKLVPGTHSTAFQRGDLQVYRRALRTMLTHLESHHVKCIFVLFVSFDRYTGSYDAAGPYQNAFAQFANAKGIRLVYSDQLLTGSERADLGLRHYFQDDCHMTNAGNEALGRALRPYVEELFSERATAKGGFLDR